MKLLWLLSAAIGLAQTGAAAVAKDLPPIKQVVSFGDSLTDAGSFGVRFTTNPGMTFAQHLAIHYGQRPLPNEHIDSYDRVYKGVHGLPGPGGLDYAEGGAKANSAYSSTSEDPEGVPISAAMQLKHFLAQHHAFSPDQLVTFYIGTNDAAYDFDPDKAPEIAQQLRADRSPTPEVMARERTRVEQAADDAARTVSDILHHGAERVLVFKLMDLGMLPWFRTPAARSFVSELGHVFNERLMAKLPKSPDHLLVIDTERFARDLVANKVKFGFTHGANEDACRQDDQDYCYPDTMKAPDADRTFIFVAGEHMTTKANELLADYVLEQLNESPLR